MIISLVLNKKNIKNLLTNRRKRGIIIIEKGKEVSV
nr:MAG TPA: hypothetical protein [Caudoviricetes sp.]